MAEQSVPEIADTNSEQPTVAAEDMDVETLETAQEPKAEASEATDAANGEPNSKRTREEGAESGEENGGVSKKQKVDEKSVEEQRLEKLGDEESGPVELGPKSFGSSVEMFDYFYKLQHYWAPNLNINKYEHMVLLDLIQKGHPEPDKKIGGGVRVFQVRYHPTFKSRCFFIIRDDDSVDDFSFRKCVDRILPLPEDMRVKSDANKALGRGGGKGRGGRGGGGRGSGRGGWRGGKSRN
ncbi:hypothetical protein UlMin_008272 [Ulmus minor]